MQRETARGTSLWVFGSVGSEVESVRVSLPPPPVFREYVLEASTMGTLESGLSSWARAWGMFLREGCSQEGMLE